jgi:hypothetical protein
MSKTTRLAHPLKKKRYISSYNEGGLVKKDKPVVAHIVRATTIAQTRPITKKEIIVTGDKFNTYKTQRT